MLLGSGWLMSMMITAYLAHPVHIGVANVELQPEKREFIISIKLYSNDLQDALSKKYGIGLIINDTASFNKNFDVIIDYFKRNFVLTIDEKNKLDLKFQKRYNDNEATWINFTADITNAFKSLTIRNTILMELYPDQTNLLIVAYPGFENGYYCTTDSYNISLDVNQDLK